MTDQFAALDRLEIQDLLARYCHAIDARCWDKLRSLFAAGARLDLESLNGPAGTVEDAIAHMTCTMSRISHTQHMVNTTTITFEDGIAKSTSAGSVVVVWTDRFGNNQVAFIGVWYTDQLVREAQGWKFAQRVVECSWADNIPHDRWIRSFAFAPKTSDQTMLRSVGF